MTALTDVSVHDLMADIGRRARAAARRLARASTEQKAAALVADFDASIARVKAAYDPAQTVMAVTAR